MRVLFLSILFLGLVFTASGAGYEEEEKVLVLKDDDFDGALKDFNYLLVEFYAPWCGHCKSLAPEYAAAAQQLDADGSEIKLAKVDATVETALASRFEIKGYPTLKFFVDGEQREYNGGRTQAEIVSWLKKKTGPAFVEIKTVEEAQKFTDKDEVTVIGFFKSTASEAVDLFRKVAQSVDEIPFALTSDDAIRKKYSISSDASIVMFRKFEEQPLTIPDELDSVAGIKDFITNNLLPKVVEFTDEVAPKIFGGSIKVHSLLFLDASNDIRNYLEWYKEVAQEFTGRMMFIYVDVNKPSNARIVDYFGIKSDSVPDYRLIEMGAENMNKYKHPSSAISKASVIKMLNSFENNLLEPFYKSEELPNDWDKSPVKVLVGTNFKQVAFDEDKNVLVEFYAPWCGHCKTLAPIWDELGEKFSSNKDIIIAKVDATANEIPEVPVSGFPTIKFFPAGSKSIVDYDGGRDLDSFVSFLKKKGVQVDDSEADESEEHDEL